MSISKTTSFVKSMKEYKTQLKKGDIQNAYRGLMAYFRELSSHFISKYPEYSASTSIYYGYMDMTYFPIFPESLKHRKLKIAVVFVHDTFRFEVWLSGSNRSAQEKCWKLLKENNWKKYHYAANPKNQDFVLSHILVEDPDFSDLNGLTAGCGDM